MKDGVHVQLIMTKLILSSDAGADEIVPLALAINDIILLPVTMRSARCAGVRVENGKVVDKNYTGPVLEEVLATGKAARKTPEKGPYKGIPVAVTPIVVDGEAVAAIGIVDVVGTIDIPAVFGAYADVVRQVSESR
jgi:hypothetical protein